MLTLDEVADRAIRRDMDEMKAEMLADLKAAGKVLSRRPFRPMTEDDIAVLNRKKKTDVRSKSYTVPPPQ
ncbi:MAG: hypothetical protein LBN39_04275 [Planctomycetaceae bacterium]|jgi:hypothetical protein|nr:hypothetical protein [Planctomycetaceae bacterium]